MSNEIKTNRAQREDFTTKAFRLTQTLSILTIIVVAVQMLTSALDIGNLETTEFVAVITATSASTLGLWFFTGRGL